MTITLTILSLLLSMLFSALESAFFSLSRSHLRHQIFTGETHFAELEKLLHRSGRLLFTITFLKRGFQLGAWMLGSLWLWEQIEGVSILPLAAVTLFILWIVEELIVRLVYVRFSLHTLRFFSKPLGALGTFFEPLMIVGKLLLHPRLRTSENPPAEQARENLSLLTRALEQRGEISSIQRQLIENTIAISQTKVSALMYPLNKVVAIPLEMPADKILAFAQSTSVDRMPVLSPEGEFVGWINIFEMLLEKKPQGTALQYLQRIIHLQPDDPISTAFQRLRQSGMTIAVVKQNGYTGLIFLENIFEALLRDSVTDTIAHPATPRAQ